MKVVMLNYEFPPIGGGGGQANLNLLRHYAGRPDLYVDCLTSAPEPGLFTESLAPNVTIHKVGIHKRDLHHWRRTEVLAWLAKAGRRYARMVREGRYDLAHAFFAFPTGWLCWRSADQLPYVISMRGSDVPGLHGRLQLDYKVLAPVMRRIWARAGALVAVSEGLKARALRFMPDARIQVIPNGVDLDRFSPATGPRPDGPLRLLSVGRLSVTKRVDLLIEAVDLLKKAGMDCRLTIAGGGSLEQDLRNKVLGLELTGLVDLAGRVDSARMPDLYRGHDLFISATSQEGMSNAMLEAMASGLPIVTTRCEGVEELIADNGIVVDDPADLVNAIQSLAQDRIAMARMGKAALSQAVRFSWSAVADQYIQCYRQVLQQRITNNE